MSTYRDLTQVVQTSHFLRDASTPAELRERLNAAAQEMLEVLETIENDDGIVPGWLWNRIQDVVRKAGGRPK